jgi:hypothetical protein
LRTRTRERVSGGGRCHRKRVTAGVISAPRFFVAVDAQLDAQHARAACVRGRRVCAARAHSLPVDLALNERRARLNGSLC